MKNSVGVVADALNLIEHSITNVRTKTMRGKLINRIISKFDVGIFNRLFSDPYNSKTKRILIDLKFNSYMSVWIYKVQWD